MNPQNHTQAPLTFIVGGMDCPSCEGTVTKAVARLSGVEKVEANHLSMKLYVFGDTSAEQQQRIVKHIRSLGYRPQIDGKADTSSDKKSIPWTNLSITVSGLLIVIASFFKYGFEQTILADVFLLCSMPLSGFLIFRKGITGFINRNLDMNSLMTLAVIGALFIGEWFEGALVLFLGAIAEAMEAWSSNRARHAVEKLMELTPSLTTVRRNGIDIDLPPAEIMKGETLVIKPGAQVPLDARIIDGTSELDQSAITGESLPVAVEQGDSISSGSINGTGVLLALVTKTLENSTVSRIARLVEEAQTNKSRTQRFIDRFASIYTPAVVFIAAGIVLFPPIVTGNWFEWLYRALVMLIIACPCALVISTPAAIVSGLAAAARSGLVIRGGEFLERGNKITALAFDKTGTLTEGNLSVAAIYTIPPFSESEVLQVAASVETGSEHPIGRAILERTEREGISVKKSANISAIPGKGITGSISSINVSVGTAAFIGEKHHQTREAIASLISRASSSKSLVFVTIESQLAGAIALSDNIRPEAEVAVAQLHRLLGNKLHILSGDDETIVAELAGKTAIDNYHGRLLPDDKLEYLGKLQHSGDSVMMVGDGINDAPALALADIGVAMGGRSSDITLESADVALVGDDLRKLPYFLNLSRQVMRIISENIGLSLGIKLLFLLLSGFGYITLWLAVIADTGLSLLVTANSLRLLTMKREFGSAENT